ncbi:hypothetical protein [Blautia sp.]|uniref:hypothetical protein n=1 Tax=Blautia sp. TaxID=1955243 RepID=UPI0025903F23|nr:hypothetical protein [Blautia sp.]
MEYDKELKALQTWLKDTAGLNSFKRGVGLKLARPVVLFDSPGRSRARHITRYSYVQTVQWFGTLYVDNLDEAIKYQEALVQNLEDKCGVLEVKDDAGNIVGRLKNAELKFKEAESLDIAFTLSYEAAYKRAGWDTPVPQIDIVHANLKLKPE